MADADPDAAKLRAEAGVDRSQAVMPGGPAAELHLDLERREVELVVKDGQGVPIELIEAQRLLNRIAAVVHEGLGLEQQNAVSPKAPFGDQASEFLLPRTEIMRFGDDVGRHEPDIVPLKRIFCAGVTKADPELHAFPSPSGEGTKGWGLSSTEPPEAPTP